MFVPGGSVFGFFDYLFAVVVRGFGVGDFGLGTSFWDE